MQTIKLPEGQKIYFASDFHLGYPSGAESQARERRLVACLDKFAEDAHTIFFLGDIFDFWFEYKYVIPKGFVRFQGKVAELVDKGVDILFFVGNHDLWMYTYFQEELGVRIFYEPQSFSINGIKFLVGHGDGTTKKDKDKAYKILKRYVFKNPLLEFCFSWLNPNIGVWLAHTWSNHRKAKAKSIKIREDFIYEYCKSYHREDPHQYYIFGHTHSPNDLKIDSQTHYINLGTWLHKTHYACFDGYLTKLEIF